MAGTDRVGGEGGGGAVAARSVSWRCSVVGQPCAQRGRVGAPLSFRPPYGRGWWSTQAGGGARCFFRGDRGSSSTPPPPLPCRGSTNVPVPVGVGEGGARGAPRVALPRAVGGRRRRPKNLAAATVAAAGAAPAARHPRPAPTPPLPLPRPALCTVHKSAATMAPRHPPSRRGNRRPATRPPPTLSPPVWRGVWDGTALSSPPPGPSRHADQIWWKPDGYPHGTVPGGGIRPNGSAPLQQRPCPSPLPFTEFLSGTAGWPPPQRRRLVGTEGVVLAPAKSFLWKGGGKEA